MNYTFKFLLFTLFFIFTTDLQSQNFKELVQNVEIKNFYEGDNFNMIKIKDGLHHEIIENKYEIISKISWTNENIMYLEILQNNVPDIPFTKGEILKYSFLKKLKNFIIYEGEIRGKKFKGKYELMK